MVKEVFRPWSLGSILHYGCSVKKNFMIGRAGRDKASVRIARKKRKRAWVRVQG